MKTYRIQSRETGELFEDGLTLEGAESLVQDWETGDKIDGIYTRNFYEIVEE